MKNMIGKTKRLARRWRGRTWTCRCGTRVFKDSRCCLWHDSVREHVLDGRTKRAEDAR